MLSTRLYVPARDTSTSIQTNRALVREAGMTTWGNCWLLRDWASSEASSEVFTAAATVFAKWKVSVRQGFDWENDRVAKERFGKYQISPSTQEPEGEGRCISGNNNGDARVASPVTVSLYHFIERKVCVY